VQRGWHDLRADSAGVGIPGAHGITCQERIALSTAMAALPGV
jgi:hypothetical protein